MKNKIIIFCALIILSACISTPKTDTKSPRVVSNSKNPAPVGVVDSLKYVDAGFINNNDGTVTKNRLVWMRCEFGRSWDGSKCIGKPKPLTWHSAKDLKYNFAGSSAWRLPTKYELEAIIQCSTGRNKDKINNLTKYCNRGYVAPAINLNVFQLAPASEEAQKSSDYVFWTGNSSINDYLAPVIDFKKAIDDGGVKSQKYNFILVRNE